MSSNEVDLDEETVEAIEQIAERGESIESVLTVIERFEESGLLDLLDVVSSRDMERNEQLYEVFAEDPGSLRAVQNLSLVAGGLARMDPDALATTMGGEAVPHEKFEKPPELGLLGILRQLRDPDVRRGLGTVFLLLKFLGTRSDETGMDEAEVE